MDQLPCTQCGYSIDRARYCKPSQKNTSPSLNALSAMQNAIIVNTALFDEYANQRKMIFGQSMIMFEGNILK